MKPHPVSCNPIEVDQKAKLARRRSRLVWPDTAFLGVQTNVRCEALIALRESVPDYWHLYRSSPGPLDRAKVRSYLRAKITAIRILKRLV